VLHASYSERRAQLEALNLNGVYWQTPETFDDGQALFDAVCAHKPEGVVAKRRCSRYLPGERGWIKTKNRNYWRYEMERESAINNVSSARSTDRHGSPSGTVKGDRAGGSRPPDAQLPTRDASASPLLRCPVCSERVTDAAQLELFGERPQGPCSSSTTARSRSFSTSRARFALPAY
jgi:hypothetical protein